jgi:glutathione S-transferase
VFVCVSVLLTSFVRKYPSGKKLIPEGDDEAYARFEQACSVEQSYFAAAAETIGTELIIKP